MAYQFTPYVSGLIYKCWHASEIKWSTDAPIRPFLCGGCRRQGVLHCKDKDCDLSSEVRAERVEAEQ